MPICLVEEVGEYTIQGTTFVYERLRSDDRDKITYLSVQRGQLDQSLYDKICITVGLKRWEQLYGQNGLIAWPFALREGTPNAGLTPEQLLSLTMLFPALTQERREQLNGTYYVVDHLPLAVALGLLQRINDLEPDAIKKNWPTPLADGSNSPVDGQGMSLPAMTVDASMPTINGALPATAEG